VEDALDWRANSQLKKIKKIDSPDWKQRCAEMAQKLLATQQKTGSQREKTKGNHLVQAKAKPLNNADKPDLIEGKNQTVANESGSCSDCSIFRYFVGGSYFSSVL
jgi:hypothetical protein